MSGTALNYNAYHDGNHKCLMYAIAANASKPANNLPELIAFLKNASATQIQNYVNDNVFIERPIAMNWAPVIESLYNSDKFADKKLDCF